MISKNSIHFTALFEKHLKLLVTAILVSKLSLVAADTLPGKDTRGSFNPIDAVLFSPCLRLSGGGDLNGYWRFPMQLNQDATLSIVFDENLQYLGTENVDGCRTDFLDITTDEQGAIVGAQFRTYNAGFLPDIEPNGLLPAGAGPFVIKAELDTNRLAEGFYFNLIEVRLREDTDNSPPQFDLQLDAGDLTPVLRIAGRGADTPHRQAVLRFSRQGVDPEGDLTRLEISNASEDIIAEGRPGEAFTIDLFELTNDKPVIVTTVAIDELGATSDSIETRIVTTHSAQAARIEILSNEPRQIPSGNEVKILPRVIDINGVQNIGIPIETSMTSPGIVNVLTEEADGILLQATGEGPTELIFFIPDSHVTTRRRYVAGDGPNLAADFTVRGELFFDEAKDGNLQSELSVPGIRVDLLRNSEVVQSQRTIGGKMQGFMIDSHSSQDDELQVRFEAPSGFSFSPRGSAIDGLDSDVVEDGDDAGKSELLNTTGNNQIVVNAGLVQDVDKLDDFDSGDFNNALGDLVWFDDDRNGLQGAGESGASGIRISLRSAVSGDLWAETFSGAMGFYSFEEIPPGNYFIEAELPEDLTFSPNDSSNDQLNSDIVLFEPRSGLRSRQRTEIIILDDGDVFDTVDIGIMEGFGIEGRIWVDVVTDNLEAESPESLNFDPGLDEVEISLWYYGTARDDIPYIFDITRTTLGGYYRFSGLPDKLPNGESFFVCFFSNSLVPVLPDQGAEQIDSDFKATTLSIAPGWLCSPDLEAVEPGMSIIDIDGGVILNESSNRQGSLDITACYDASEENCVGSSVELLSDVEIEVCDSQNHCQQALTDVSGNASFDGLWQGNATIRYKYSEGGAVEYTKTAIIEPNEALELILAYRIKIVLSGTVWEDVNGDGIRDVQEPKLKDVPIEIDHREAAFQHLPLDSPLLTDSSGYWSKSYFYAGWDSPNYYVRVIDNRDNLHFTLKDFGVVPPPEEDSPIDSDVDMVTGVSDHLIASGQGAVPESSFVVDAGMTSVNFEPTENQVTVDLMFDLDGEPLTIPVTLVWVLDEAGIHATVSIPPNENILGNSNVGIYFANAELSNITLDSYIAFLLLFGSGGTEHSGDSESSPQPGDFVFFDLQLVLDGTVDNVSCSSEDELVLVRDCDAGGFNNDIYVIAGPPFVPD